MSQRIFILGATGNTGAELIDLGLARGHTLTAFVRSPDKITRRDPRLSIVRGNPRSADEIATALRGHDAVASAIGTRPPAAFRAHTTVQECAASTVAAMQRTDVKRLAFVSAAVLFDEPGLTFAFFRWVLKHIARDLDAAEHVIRATPFDWTIARPPRLVRDANDHYRTARDALPSGGRVLSFRGVAAFMLDAIEQGSHRREMVGITR